MPARKQCRGGLTPGDKWIREGRYLEQEPLDVILQYGIGYRLEEYFDNVFDGVASANLLEDVIEQMFESDVI